MVDPLQVKGQPGGSRRLSVNGHIQKPLVPLEQREGEVQVGLAG